jgi:hypothetical protein
MFVRVWEYEVPDDTMAAFCVAYAPLDGLATVERSLLKDCPSPDREVGHAVRSPDVGTPHRLVFGLCEFGVTAQATAGAVASCAPVIPE